MAHAHPSDAVYLPPQFAYARSQQPSPTITSVETQPRHFTSPQQNCLTRRLQLRNAGFRGPTIPARKVTPFTVRSPSVQEPFTLNHSTNDENTPRTAERRTLYGEDLPPSPVSILQEISNTSRRKHQSQPSITTIFQDSTATKDLDNTSTTSWYHEASNNPSPSLVENPRHRTMKLREVSLNERVAPGTAAPVVSTKVPKKATVRRKSRTRSRAGSFEATKYIEHLESELTSLNTKLDAITSPTRSKAQSTKLRALTNQNRTLREELSEWEKRFDERVSDEIMERSQVEQGLKSRVKALEEDTETKDVKIQELDKEIEICRTKLREIDSLELTNQSLERRVDVLTELLAQSPIRANPRLAVDTLGNTDSIKRTLRPKSLLLPRISPSPTSTRFSASYAIDVNSWHTRHTASISRSSIAETPEDEVLSPLELGSGSFSQPLYAAQHVARASNRKNATSTQLQSPSRPTSMISNSSSNSSWGLPITASAIEDCKSTDRPRKMRRFPSGTCSLKPLILPATTAVTQCLPASAPAYSNYSTPFREFSNTSIDPTTAFLSKPLDSSPFTTPTQPARQRSTSWAQKQALDALEGRSNWTTDLVCQEQSELVYLSVGGQEESLIVDGCEAVLAPKPKRRSLQMELQQAQEDEFMNGTASPAITEALLESTVTVEQLMPHASSLGESVLVGGGNTTTDEDVLRQRRAIINTPMQSVSFRSLAPSPVKSFPASAVIPATTLGMFSKLTSLVTAMRQDPLILARKILVTAWTTGSSRLGGLGWWLLGLIYRSGQRKEERTADADVVEEEVPNDDRWGSQPLEGSKARKLMSYDRITQLSKGSRAHAQSRGKYDPCGTSEDPESRSEVLQSTEPIHVCKDCVEPSSRRSLRLWLRFSLAIVLAVGVAVKDGPGTLLEDLPPQHTYDQQSRETDPERLEQREGEGTSSEHTLIATPYRVDLHGFPQPRSHNESPGSRQKDVNAGHWGMHYTFAQNLGPADFENTA
ncbi:hypothetical protein MMC18_002818 [Xylographa bjoerkii]|nr:hypothetical protein [Xylographa bjoerkii]